VAVALAFAVATFVFHIATAGGYGYQRDELYFVSCARHLDWSYVDQPPLIALVAKVALALFGDSLYGLRLLPALAAGAIVYVTGRVARNLGGGYWAQATAMLGIALAPFYLAVGNLLTLNAFEPLLWAGAAYLFAEAARGDRRRTWLAFGLVSGLGLVNKYSMFFFLGACAVGIALSPERRALLRPGFALAVAIALAIVSPTLLWQAHHNWPQLEVLRNAALAKNIDENVLVFYGQQVMMMSPFSAPLWLPGLYALLFVPELRAWRWYGIAYVVLSIAYASLHAKVYYMAPIYPIVFAAGGRYAEMLFARWRAGRTGARWAYAVSLGYPALLLAGGLLIAPSAFPLLPLDMFLAYERFIDVRDVKMEKHPEGLVPQQFADMLGWDTLVKTLAAAYHRLPPAQRHETVILTHDYGQASAVDFLGPDAGLPQAISGHNNYYLYGTRGYSGDVVLAIGLPKSVLAEEYRHIRQVGLYHDPYVLPDFNDLPIYLCTQPRVALAQWWPRLKRYI